MCNNHEHKNCWKTFALFWTFCSCSHHSGSADLAEQLQCTAHCRLWEYISSLQGKKPNWHRGWRSPVAVGVSRCGWYCKWTDYLNRFDQRIYFQCDHDYVLTGVNSYHYDGACDRRWKAKCCKSLSHFVQKCRVSGYINSYHSYMDFSVDSLEVFTGLFSAHWNFSE